MKGQENDIWSSGKVMSIDGCIFIHESWHRHSYDKFKEFEALIVTNKKKVKSGKEKIQMLTLVPISWSKQKIQDTFGVNEYLVRHARLLKEENGILVVKQEIWLPTLSRHYRESSVVFWIRWNFKNMFWKKDFVSISRNQEKNWFAVT